MGQCCASHPGDQNELNDMKKPAAVGNGEDGNQLVVAQTEAALKIQANYRGVKTRKQVKEEFGFESKTIND